MYKDVVEEPEVQLSGRMCVKQAQVPGFNPQQNKQTTRSRNYTSNNKSTVGTKEIGKVPI